MDTLTIDYNESTGAFVLISGMRERCTLSRPQAFDRYMVSVRYNNCYHFTDAAQLEMDRDIEEMAMIANVD